MLRALRTSSFLSGGLNKKNNSKLLFQSFSKTTTTNGDDDEKSKYYPFNENLELKGWTTKCETLDENVTKYKDMQKGVMYSPSNARDFPLVDMYHLNSDGKLIGLKASYEKKLPTYVSTFEKFYEILDTTPEETELNLFYVILPNLEKHFLKGPYDESFFWKDDPATIDNKWRERIKFHVLVPPEDFERNYPDEE